MGFLKKTVFNNSLSIEDLMYLAKLLDTDLSLAACFDLLKNSKNALIFQNIKDRLDKGEMIEKIIGDYLPKAIKAYILPLLDKMSLLDALNLALDFYNRHNESQKELLSSIAYPCILLFVTLTALYLFDLYGMNSVFQMVNSFNYDVGLYQDFRILFRILINIIYYLMLLLIILGIVFLQNKRIVWLFIFFSTHFPNSLVNTYYSEEFISLLLLCIERGYKSKQALSILMQMKTKPLIAFLAFHLDEALMQGESLKQASEKKYYDQSLPRFIKIASYTNDFSGVLNSYTILARYKLKKKMKQYASSIQACTYAFMGLIIIFIYQILFMPMQALSGF